MQSLHLCIEEEGSEEWERGDAVVGVADHAFFRPGRPFNYRGFVIGVLIIAFLCDRLLTISVLCSGISTIGF
jgi:hypothetical protein